MAKTLLGVIDVGSHSVHFEIFESRKGYEPRSLYSKSELSHLGRTVGREGRIPPGLVHHLQAAIRRFTKKAKKKHVEIVLIGATAGLRKASNGEDVIQQLERKIDFPIHLLDPERESELGFLGVQSDLDARSNQLFIDCGGGSTEISLARGRQRLAHATLPFGSNLLSLKVNNDPPQASDIVQIMLPWIEGFKSLPNSLKPQQALVSGGMILKLMALLAEEMPTIVTLKHLSLAADIVMQKKYKKLAKKYDLEIENTWNLLPAALMLSSLLTYYHLDRATVTEKSVRNGIARAYQTKGKDWWKRKNP